MSGSRMPVKAISMGLVALGTVLLAVNLIWGKGLNLALPLVFIALGALLVALAAPSPTRWSWAPLLYLPGPVLIATGLIFLLNVLTGDWNAWAYAWLLVVASAGAGVILAGRHRTWRPLVSQAGWLAVLTGLTLFIIFGAVAGGRFIQIMAPLMLIGGGFLLYWLRTESSMAGHNRPELPFRQAQQPGMAGGLPEPLIEPLSRREMDVLHQVELGLSNQQIALKLNIAPSTVKTHINNIYAKLGVETRTQAVRRAHQIGLIDEKS